MLKITYNPIMIEKNHRIAEDVFLEITQENFNVELVRNTDADFDYEIETVGYNIEKSNIAFVDKLLLMLIETHKEQNNNKGD